MDNLTSMLSFFRVIFTNELFFIENVHLLTKLAIVHSQGKSDKAIHEKANCFLLIRKGSHKLYIKLYSTR